MQLNGYSNITKFTEGGMATLYKAYQQSLDRTVIIKLLSVQSFWDKNSKKLFDQEALVIAKLSHPNIVHIIDRGVNERGRPYFVMEYIKGMDLSELIKTKQLSVKYKINILLQCAKGIAFAHKNKVIHRDIKPANILINTEGHVQILDFGIAWIMSAKQDPDADILGTPDYMSPEQFSSPLNVNHLSDVYSFGVVMYELLSKKLPAVNNANIAQSMNFVPNTIAQLIEQCLETRPELRPQSMDEVRLRLLQGLKGAHLSNTQKQAASQGMGKVIDKFELLDVIKHNNFGAVYLAEDVATKKLLIIKKRSQSRAGFDESRLLMKHEHPHIAKILGAIKTEKAFTVVMEHLSGGNLQDRLVRPFKSRAFLRLANSLCLAMAEAHKHKIMHKSLRPSNILFDETGAIKISDFGFDEQISESDPLASVYQAPKYFGSDVVGDIYSAGSIFFQMLTGEPLTLNNKKIVENKLFTRLSAAEQNLLKNMVEKNAPERHVSFTAVMKNIDNVRHYKQRQPYVRLVKQLTFYAVAIGVALTAIAYLEPDLYRLVMSQVRDLLGG